MPGGTPCPDSGCQAYNGHTPLCRLAPPEYKAAQLASIYKRKLELQASFGRLKGKVTYWQAKFHLLRQENNKLRREVVRLTIENYDLKQRQTGVTPEANDVLPGWSSTQFAEVVSCWAAGTPEARVIAELKEQRYELKRIGTDNQWIVLQLRDEPLG